MSRMADLCIEVAETVADLTGLPFSDVLRVVNSGAVPLDLSDMPPRKQAARVRAALAVDRLAATRTRSA